MEYSEITTLKQLANYLRCKPEFLNAIIKNGYYVKDYTSDKVIDENFNCTSVIITKFGIKKKNPKLGYRTIFKPIISNLSNTLKILDSSLCSIYRPLPCVHGFIKGRNIKTNAMMHIGKKTILSLDIKDFFETIDENRIVKSLIELGFKEQVASWISKIVTVNGYLVQGFNTSPCIANIIAQKMDKALENLCGNSITYTRYADDMYFSSNTEFIEPQLFVDTIQSFGFSINSDKTKIMNRGEKQYVTGLTVFDNKYPRITRKIKRNLRLEIYYVAKYGYRNHVMRKLGLTNEQLKDDKIRTEVHLEVLSTKNRLWGWISFIRSIEPQFGNKLEEKLIERPYHKVFWDFYDYKFLVPWGNKS